MKQLWQSFQLNIWKLAGAVITDTKVDGRVAVSLGRLGFISVLGFMFFLWNKSIENPDITMPPGLMEVFYTFAGYVLGTKVLEVIRKVKEPKEEMIE